MTDEVVFVMLVGMEVVLGLLIDRPDDGELLAGAFWVDKLSALTSRLALSLLLQRKRKKISKFVCL